MPSAKKSRGDMKWLVIFHLFPLFGGGMARFVFASTRKNGGLGGILKLSANHIVSFECAEALLVQRGDTVQILVSAMADPNEGLLPGWTAVADEEGDYYYWNEETDEVKFSICYGIVVI